MQCQTRIVLNNALRIQSITNKIYLKTRNNTAVVYTLVLNRRVYEPMRA